LTVQIIHKNCDPTLADDKSLPYTAYIVKYYENDQYCYDIVICNKKVDIFDYYWDRYREDLVSSNKLKVVLIQEHGVQKTVRKNEH